MKTYDETYNSVMAKGDAYFEKKRSRDKKIKKIAVSGACVIAAAFTAAVCFKFFGEKPALSRGDGSPESVTLPAIEEIIEETSNELLAGDAPGTEPSSGESAESTTAVPPELSTVSGGDYAVGYTMEFSTASENEGGDIAGYGGETPNGGNIAYFNKAVTGEPITDEEAAAYFAENRQSLISSLSSSGVDTSDFRIMEKGYCHMNIENGKLETRVNFRDYLVYSGSELISIVTLYRQDGKIYSSPAFGGPWFSTYNDFLQAHKGEELVYVYCGIGEYIITPDNQIVNPMGYEIMPEFFTSDFDYYSALNVEWNTYTP